jgi:hypothetical protein
MKRPQLRWPLASVCEEVANNIEDLDGNPFNSVSSYRMSLRLST